MRRRAFCTAGFIVLRIHAVPRCVPEVCALTLRCARIEAEGHVCFLWKGEKITGVLWIFLVKIFIGDKLVLNETKAYFANKIPLNL